MSWFRRTRADPDPQPSLADRERVAAQWQAWRRDVFGDGHEVWHDGPNTDESTPRWLADRAGTERMLLIGLAADDDATAIAIEDLAAAGHTPGAEVVAALVAAGADGRPPRMRVAALPERGRKGR